MAFSTIRVNVFFHVPEMVNLSSAGVKVNRIGRAKKRAA
jgi:hypothetical protein